MNSSVLGAIILGMVLFVIILAVINGAVLSLFDVKEGRQGRSSLSSDDS